MTLSLSRRRLALWAIAAALLLRSAVPMLASAAAQWQGRSVAEVCTVYGVQLGDGRVADHAGHGVDHAGHVVGQAGQPGAEPVPGEPAPQQASQSGGHSDGHSDAHSDAHANDHCALTALSALAAQALPALLPGAGARGLGLRVQALPSPAWDAEASWVARQKHGPPRLG